MIFVTAYDQYAIEAFEVNAIDYLLKPVRAARLLAALAKARAGGAVSASRSSARLPRPGSPRRFLSVHERGRIHLVPVADIVLLKAELKYVTVRTAEREFLLEESLAQPGGGVRRPLRAHAPQRAWSRASAIARFRADRRRGRRGAGWAVVLDGVAEKLPVSRRQWAAVKALASG